MKPTKLKKSYLVLFLAVFVAMSFFSLASNAATNDGRVIQNDSSNPIKFSIDAKIANGSISTKDLYIGTVKSFLGAKADGKTPVFKGGFGQNPNDILITNGKVGIVLAAGTPDPWGYPGGSILDAGRVTSVPAGATDLKGATFGEDTTLTTQFLFNSWDAWAPSNAGIVYFDLVKYNFKTKQIDDANGMPAVQVKRKFAVPYNNEGKSVARDLDVISYYSIAPGKDYAYMIDTVKNNGAAFNTMTDNEVCISNKGGDGIDTKTIAALTAANTYNFVTDAGGKPTRQFSTTLISPGLNPGSDGRNHPFAGFTGATGYREFKFSNLDYVEGESRLYESYLMIDNQASWQKVYDFWAGYKGLDKFNVSGSVADTNGKPVPYPAVVIYRGSTFYGWVMGDENGEYTANLPKENSTQQYYLQVEATGKTVGAPSTTFTSATVPAGGIDLKAGADLVPVTFNFKDPNNNPVWGRVAVGNVPTVAFTGKNYFFSDNAADGSVTKGKVTALVAPGNYSATCYGEGFGFYSYTSNSTTYSQTITGNTDTNRNHNIVINKILSAPTDWFSIDNHHHGQRSDAFSPPEVVAKAQITAGLDVLTLDDHEYIIDNPFVYDWAKKMAAKGYMPSEEITPSWAHFDIMPQTKNAFTRFLDRAQKNATVNANSSLQGIIDDGHNAGVAVGANHPNSWYGLFWADDNNTVPGGMSEDFDGIEAQFSTTTLNEVISIWNAYLTGGTHRGVKITKPHYIYASTDIHNSGTGTNTGARRSYVYVKDGAAKSKADYDGFSLEFARSQAAGHSYNSSGVFVTPTDGKMFGNTYKTDASGTFTATFNISSLNDITDIYVFGSTGTTTATGSFPLKNCVSRTTFTGSELSKSKDFTIKVDNVKGKQWYAIAAVSSAGKLAFTNPIWVNGPDVPETQTITAIKPIIKTPVLPVDGKVIEEPVTGIMTTTPWSSFLFADWKLENGKFGSTVAKNGVIYIYSLTFEAPNGFVFDSSLSDGKNHIKVSNDGKSITYKVYMNAAAGPVIKVKGVRLNKTSTVLNLGNYEALRATIIPANATNKGINWSSSNVKVATVTSTGVIKAVGTGKATIYAITADGKFKASCSIIVKIPVKEIKLNRSYLNLEVRKNGKLAVTIYPLRASNKEVTWSSSNPGIATVNGNGAVTAKAKGTAIITVTSKDSLLKAICKVNVK